MPLSGCRVAEHGAKVIAHKLLENTCIGGQAHFDPASDPELGSGQLQAL